MFRNFHKVFRFTFKNQFTTPGYIRATIVVGLLLFGITVAVFVLPSMIAKDEETDSLASCGADRIYVVNEVSPDSDLNGLNLLGIEGYTDIEYINSNSIDEALSTISDQGEVTSLIMDIKKDDRHLTLAMIVPDSSLLGKDQVENYGDFAVQAGASFVIGAAGINSENLVLALAESEYDVYNVSGYMAGEDIYADEEMMEEKSNSEILPMFNMILTYVTIFIIYMVIILYGNSILQNIVLEKTSKLMDTMLISVSPQAMIFGKMMGILLTGIIQLLIWLAAVVLGFVTGATLYGSLFDGANVPVVTFLLSFAELGIFKPVNVILGILALVMGVVLYSSMAAIAGAISSSREEASSNQGLFIVILVVCFYLVLINGLTAAEAPTWLYLLPFTSAMVLPSVICTGSISMTVALAGMGIMLVCLVVFLVVAGRLYKMMSLYKGSPVKIGKALKMLLAGR